MGSGRRGSERRAAVSRPPAAGGGDLGRRCPGGGARLDPAASGSVTRRGAGVEEWGGAVAGERRRGRDEADGAMGWGRRALGRWVCGGAGRERERRAGGGVGVRGIGLGHGGGYGGLGGPSWLDGQPGMWVGRCPVGGEGLFYFYFFCSIFVYYSFSIFCFILVPLLF